MKQQTLAMAGDQNAQYEQYRKPTKRDVFLATMEQIVPWAELCGVIEPFYPKPGNGRPPVGLERMLRMYFVQQWFNLADVACEDALLDSTALRRFVGIDLGGERVPHSRSARLPVAASISTSQTWHPLVKVPCSNVKSPVPINADTPG